MDDRNFEDELLPRVLRLDAEAPDPNLVAAYVDGTLPEDERRRLEREIEVNPEAMLLVRALRSDRRRLILRRVALAAAALLVAVGGAAVVLRSKDADAGSLEDRLVAAAKRLRESDASTFGEFAPLRAEELTTTPSVTRGGGRVLWPVGVLLSAPGEIRWRAPDGATRVRVAVEGPGLDWSVESDGDRTPAPRLVAGRYAVRVRALDAIAGQGVRGAFVVATETEAARHARALALIRADAPPALVDLLVAHYALRQSLYSEARRAAESARARPEAREMADALLRHLASIAPDAP